MEKVSVETQTSLENLNLTNDFRSNRNQKINFLYRIISQIDINIKDEVLHILLKIKLLLRNNLLLVLILISAGFGIGLGFALRSYNLSSETKEYLGFPGELFVRALKFIVFPLYVCNLITGISGIAKKTKKIAMTTFIFYCVSLISALLISFLFVLTIKPGKINKTFNFTMPNTLIDTRVSTSDVILDILRLI